MNLGDGVLVRKFLRQKRCANGEPGAYTLRFMVWMDGNMRLKPRRVEVGLETTELDEAVFAARVFLHGLLALGARFSGLLGGMAGRVNRGRRKKRRRGMAGLPLFENLPPFGPVDMEGKKH